MASTLTNGSSTTPRNLMERFRERLAAQDGGAPRELLVRLAGRVLRDWSAAPGGGRPESDLEAGLAGLSALRPEAVRALSALSEIVAESLLAEVPARSAREVAKAMLSLQHCCTAVMEAVTEAGERRLLDRSRDAMAAHRQRLAREVHDEFGNGLSVIMRRLELYKLTLERTPGQAPERLDALTTSIGELFDVVRWLTTDLSPCAGPSELEKTLGDFLDAIEPTTTRVGVAVHGWEHWLTDEVRCEVGTVVREALRNTLRHAEASRVSVHVHVTPDTVRAVVADDGRGFRPGPGDGHGLRSMRERVEKFGGTLDIASSPQGGTRVDAWIPFAQLESLSSPSPVPR
jgi:signal transduction histidine kinase